MLDDPSIRLLAAVGTSVALGSWLRRRAAPRLQQWEDDPDAARTRAIRGVRITSSRLVYVVSAILCVGIVLLVELVVAVVHDLS